MKKRLFKFTLISTILIGFISLPSILMSNILSNNFVNSFILNLTIFQIFLYVIAPIFVLNLTISTFLNEYNTNSITNNIIKPIERYQIYISKIIALFIFFLAFCGIFFLVDALITSIFIEFNVSIIINSFAKYIFAAFALIGLSSIVALISNIFKSTVGTTLLCVFGYIVALYIGFSNITISAFLFTNFFTIPEALVVGIKNIKIITILFVQLLATIVLSSSIGIYLFEKKSF